MPWRWLHLERDRRAVEGRGDADRVVDVILGEAALEHHALVRADSALAAASMLILNRPLDDGAARIRSGQVVELKPASSSRFELSWTRIRLEGLPDTTDPARRGTELQDCPDQRHLGEDEQPFDESISMEVDGRCERVPSPDFTPGRRPCSRLGDHRDASRANDAGSE
jgi:hypothetical protein